MRLSGHGDSRPNGTLPYKDATRIRHRAGVGAEGSYIHIKILLARGCGVPFPGAAESESTYVSPLLPKLHSKSLFDARHALSHFTR